MQPSEVRMKILFLPAWYPSEANPVEAVFIREHARAAALHNDIVVLYACGDDTLPARKRCSITDGVEDGIRTVRVKFGEYWPITVRLKWLMLGTSSANAKQRSNSGESAGFISAVKRLLTFDGVVVGEARYYWNVFVAFRRMVKQGWRPDVIHAHVFTAGVPAVILGRLYRIPVVVTEHWSAISLRKLTFSQRFKARFAMNRAQSVLPVSKALQEAIEAYGIRNHFHVVPNAVDGGLFFVGAHAEKLSNTGKKNILLVTRLVPQKGVPYLLEALGQIRQKRDDFLLHVVGDGPDKAEYEGQSGRLGLTDVVTFHGAEPKPVVAQFMRDCDFFVQSSPQETFGVVYVEAMACGKPVIACDIPGPNEFINDDVGILVPPRDVNALAKTIDFMLDHYQGYSAEKIARYARERFGYEAVGWMLDEVYREVCA
ncbi:MAG: glycosyltransferase [Chloroflexi bacterium]|nr:glycosyltransferase [Chloroflexota bacterium]